MADEKKAPMKLLADVSLEKVYEDEQLMQIKKDGKMLWGKHSSLTRRGVAYMDSLAAVAPQTEITQIRTPTEQLSDEEPETAESCPLRTPSEELLPAEDEKPAKIVEQPAYAYLNNRYAKFVVTGQEYTLDEFLKNKLDEDDISEVRIPLSCKSCDQPWRTQSIYKTVPNPVPPPTENRKNEHFDVCLDGPYSPTIQEWVGVEVVRCCDNPETLYKSLLFEVEKDVPKPSPDLAEIQRAYDTLVAPLVRVVELRAPKTAQGTYSGFYNSAELVKDTFALSSIETTPNCYWTLQPIKAESCKAENNTKPYSKKGALASDKMIAGYAYIPIDFDPRRKGTVSSTDDEKKSAYDLAVIVRRFLAARDIESILADSGNGYHLLILVSLLNTPAVVLLIKSLLETLNRCFGTNEVDIDETLFNPSRILKAYGTTARKGKHTNERPWRVTKILDVPSSLVLVPENKLRELLAELQTQPQPEHVSQTQMQIPASAPAAAAERTQDAAWASVNGEPIPHGKHDTELHRIAWRLRYDGKNEVEIYDSLVAICEARCVDYGEDYKEMCRKHAHDAAKQITGEQKRDNETPLVGGRLAGSQSNEQSTKQPNEQPWMEGGFVCQGGPPSAQASSAQALVANLQQEHSEVTAAAEKAGQDYDDKLAESAEYPLHIWKGTAYYEYALLACGEGKKANFIPAAYHIGSLMTLVGAICGHRIAPEFSPSMPAHFFTVLLSDEGGKGKDTAMSWGRLCFEGTGLLYDAGLQKHQNIGAYNSDFGSARALITKFAEYHSILQEYSELTTLTEKFDIQGSGESFLNFLLSSYDSVKPRWSLVQGVKLPANLPEKINDSLIGCTVRKKWEDKIQGDRYETLIQRLNIIHSDETRTVPTLCDPDTTQIRKRLMSRIGLLEEYKLVWHYSDEAQALINRWHDELAERQAVIRERGTNEFEAFERIQVFAHRIVGHLALWLAPPPVADGVEVKPAYLNNGATEKDGSPVPMVRRSEGADKHWTVKVPADWLARAIEASEYLINIRMGLVPPPGFGIRGRIQNQIKKWAQILKDVSWPDLQRRAGLYKFDYDDAEKCLKAVERAGFVDVKYDPSDSTNRRKWVIRWIGGGNVLNKRMWKENRGGKRKNSGRGEKG
jgi:hypothetical protein